MPGFRLALSSSDERGWRFWVKLSATEELDDDENSAIALSPALNAAKERTQQANNIRRTERSFLKVWTSSLRVVTDRLSGYSKGFGFVRYSTLEEAAQGITGMDGKFLDGWVIFAEYARPRPPPPDQTQAPPPPQQTSEPPFNHQ
ncbi:hypothetical protein ZIOFF_040309 [Zingiber officinale]|uniref:RRM domain-containing protein n=1 Tax=Zingiber officinale TaxID=94328 RepID=A0A8J5GCF6_ZINOF|nr:hypothetical protein ZIOFF_040309 [Zingiber officinale]